MSDQRPAPSRPRIPEPTGLVHQARLRWIGIPLALILLGAGLFRFGGLRWDAACVPVEDGDVHCSETHLHPDERFLTMVADRIEPPSPLDYFDTAGSSWNPHNRDFGFFVYGTWPVHLVDWVSHRVGRDGYGGVHLVGRFLSASWSLATVLLIFVLGRRLGGDALGLLSATLLGASVMSIQHAHFFTSEAPLTFASTLAVLAAVHLQERVDGRSALLFGAAFGLAMAAKVSVISFAVLPIVAVWLGPSDSGRARRSTDRWITRHPALRRWLVLGGAGAASLIAFRLLQPYAFQGPGIFGIRLAPQWLENLDESRRLAGGWVDFPPNHQWTDRARWLFPWRNLIGVGLGPALGLTATTAWAWVGWRVVVRRRVELAMPWLAVTVIFGHQGGQWVKSLRYLMPVVPCLCLLAAWALLHCISSTRSSAWRRTAQVAATLVVVASLLWALAFTSIYRRPHTRVEASRWIYQHVEPGRAISNEAWDDALPLPLDGRIGMGDYTGELIDPYANDSPEKLEKLLETLAVADFLVVSSNRGYDSVARLPMRYPMTLRYYETLFDGRLGFRRVGEWTSFPRLLGWRFPDQRFEESFSVYDHPRVQIFERTDSFDVDTARKLLAVDWDTVRPLTPRQAVSQIDLLLDEGARTRMEASGLPAGSRLERARPGTFGAVLRWGLVLEALALGGFFITFPLFKRLADRGLMAMRAGSLLLFGWTVWMGASVGITPFSPAALRAALAAWLALAAACAWRRRREMQAWWADSRGLTLRSLAVFWAAFLGMLAIRIANPDLWHPNLGGEKPMDLAYLGAVMRSVEFPPFDPWFAGGAMNYYYFGWVLTGTLGLLTALPVDLVYNLAVPTFFALFVGCAFACGNALWAIAAPPSRQKPRSGLGGALTVALLALCGNWAILPLIWNRIRGIDFPEHHLFWNPSRTIPFVEGETTPITEFPFFTFLFADLHAHLMALPFGLLVLLLVLGGQAPSSALGGGPRAWLAVLKPEGWTLFLLALATGAAWPLNTWDAPTWLALAGLGMFVVLSERPPPGEESAHGSRRLIALGGGTGIHLFARLAILFLVGRALFVPFHQNFASAYGSVAFWQGPRTPLAAFVVHFGVVLVPLLVWVLQRHRPIDAMKRVARSGRPAQDEENAAALFRSRWIVGALTVAALLLLFLRPLDVLLFLLIVAGAFDLLHRDTATDRRWIAGLLGLGASLALLVEYVVLVGDIGRMNTVFKFYLQVWWIWGLAATSAASSWLGARTSGNEDSWTPARWSRRLGTLALATGMVLGLAYPVFGTWARVRDRVAPGAPHGLDGLRFLEHAEIHDASGPLDVDADLEAMRWLLENEPGSRTVLEASVPEYRWGSRFSRFTGLPTVIGWNWHQRQQRSAVPGQPVRNRLEELDLLYSGTDTETKLRLLRAHRVRWVVVGDLERFTYDRRGIEHLTAMPELRLAFRKRTTSIYEVASGPQSAAASEDP